jgi:hypothetical protein
MDNVMDEAHERTEMHTKFWLLILKGRDYLEVLSVKGRIILKWILREQDGNLWTSQLAQDREQYLAL